LFASLNSIYIKAQNQTDLSNYTVFQPLINPAANGWYDDFTGILLGRKQWAGIEGAPSFLTLQAVKPIWDHSLGGYIAQESIGVHSSQRAIINYSYRINLSEDYKLSFGLGLGGVVLTSNYSNVNPTEQNDEQFSGTKTIVRPDFNFGVFLFHEKYFAGLSIPRIAESSIISNNGTLEGNTSYDPLRWTYLLSGGFMSELNPNLVLSTSTLAKINLNAPIDVDLNLMLQFEKAGIGVSYRTKREILLFGELSLTNTLDLGYCYHSYFNITNMYFAGHEIYLLFRKPKKQTFKMQSPRF
jgi:type IX secretion system PorP/SprF family membrane protein